MDREEVLRLADGLAEGRTARVICPECASSRSRKNQKTPTLSLTRETDAILYFCHHCSAHDRVPLPKDEPLRFRPARPKMEPEVIDLPDPMPELGPQHLDWLASRGLSADIARQERLFPVWRNFGGTAGDGIAFPNFRNGAVRAIKYRSITDKLFTSAGKGAPFYGADGLGSEEVIVFVEGEVDRLSLMEAGVRGVVSVPNGAGSASSTLGEALFEDLGPALKKCKRAILAVDADPNGQKLRDDLARRIGKSRCWLVEWPAGIKDANDYLLRYGKEALKAYIDGAVPMPVEGLYEATAFAARLQDIYDGKLSAGLKTGISALDDHYSVPMGFVTVVTGWPNDGKSTLVDNILANLAAADDLKVATWSPENPPELHIAKLIELHAGKAFFPGPAFRMAEGEAAEHLQWVNEHFYFLAENEADDATIDSILDRAEVAVQRYGINILLLDPYNYISRPSGDLNDAEWARRLMVRLKKFAQSHEVHVFLVAHPKQAISGFTKQIPTGFHISGGAQFNNITDFGMTVFRPEGVDLTQVHVWKVRHKWHGKKGVATLEFDPLTSRFLTPMFPEGADAFFEDDL